MARPRKQGLDYFPMDVDIFDDAKMLDLNFKYGYLGEIIYIRLLTMIYDNGYYLEKTVPQMVMLLNRKSGLKNKVDEKLIEDIILYLGDIDLLDKSSLYKGIFTSKGMQKQFILSTRRRKNIDIEKHWVLDANTMKELNVVNATTCKQYVSNNSVNVDTNSIDVNSNSVNVSNNEVIVDNKYIKEKGKVKIDKKIKDKGTFQVPSLHFFTSVLIENKYIDEDSLELLKYNKLFEDALQFYPYEDCLSVMDYLMKYSKRTEVPIENKYSFLKESLFNNLEMLIKRGEYKNETIEEFFKRKLL